MWGTKFIAAILGFSWLASAAIDEPTRQLSRDIFRELIEINTTDSVGNTTTAAETMANRLRAAGFPAADVQVLGPNPRKGNLIARLHGTGAGGLKPILLIGHLDVVEARREDWTTDPFAFVEKDGYFYGRGTQDMKVTDAMFVTTFIRFKREGYRPDRDLILALTADEEGGSSNGVDWLLKNHRDLIDAEFVINGDPGNIMMDKGKPIDVEVGAAEKLYADFQLTVTNPGGHSSLPVPDNAIYHLADALARLERSPWPFELNPVTRAYLAKLATVESKDTADDIAGVLATPPRTDAIRRLSADPHYNATIRTTCVATRLNAGHANNALPQTAEALVNCRILPGHSAEEVRGQLIARLGDPKVVVRYEDGATAKITDTAPTQPAPSAIEPRQDVFRALDKIAAEMWPVAPVVPEMETGASDSKYTNAAGLPSYGISGTALDRDDIRAHGRDERVRVSAFYDGVDFFYRYLRELTPK
jgi:acetylornithine deacetylase/succinyl-diaminopimelate desuccinylase-like protein